MAAFTLFDTAVGRVAIAWNEVGVVCVGLPDESDVQAIERVRAIAGPAEPSDPPPEIAEAIRNLRAHLAGERASLAEIRLDMSRVPAFRRRIYEASRLLASGETTTYGELAARVGSPGGARAVGQAMAKNPFPIVVPCHRVLAAGNKPGGFSATGGLTLKARLLADEGAHEASRAVARGTSQQSLFVKI